MTSQAPAPLSALAREERPCQPSGAQTSGPQTLVVAAQSPQDSRRKPWAGMAHSRTASNAALMNRDSPAPLLASVGAMQPVASGRPGRYSVGLLRALALATERGLGGLAPGFDPVWAA